MTDIVVTTALRISPATLGLGHGSTNTLCFSILLVFYFVGLGSIEDCVDGFDDELTESLAYSLCDGGHGAKCFV